MFFQCNCINSGYIKSLRCARLTILLHTWGSCNWWCRHQTPKIVSRLPGYSHTKFVWGIYISWFYKLTCTYSSSAKTGEIYIYPRSIFWFQPFTVKFSIPYSDIDLIFQSQPRPHPLLVSNLWPEIYLAVLPAHAPRTPAHPLRTPRNLEQHIHRMQWQDAPELPYHSLSSLMPPCSINAFVDWPPELTHMHARTFIPALQLVPPLLSSSSTIFELLLPL